MVAGIQWLDEDAHCRVPEAPAAADPVPKDSACSACSAVIVVRRDDRRRYFFKSRAAGRLGRPVACVAARTIACAIVSAASAPTMVTSASPLQRPVASEKIVSPSPL